MVFSSGPEFEKFAAVCRRLEHNPAEIPKLVDVYATLNRIRVLSSAKVIAEADNALRIIYKHVCQGEHDVLQGQTLDQARIPLRVLSEAYHRSHSLSCELVGRSKQARDAPIRREAQNRVRPIAHHRDKGSA